MKTKIVLSVFLICGFLFSQVPENIQRYRNDKRGSIMNRLKGILDGNNVRTVFFNDGIVSDWFSGVVSGPHLEWPKGSGHRHADGFSFFVGSKFMITNTLGAEQSVTSVVTQYWEEMDKDPVTGEVWGFEPVEGYGNNSIAMSVPQSSYPAVWPAALGLTPDYGGEWYSYFGKGVREGVNEVFYVMDDSKDKEFTRTPFAYYPITADTSRGGLGLRVEVRGMQFTHSLLSDMIFWNYQITNISDRNYDTTIVGFFCDPAVGSVDNYTNLDTDNDVAYAWAPNGKGLPDNYTTGYFGIAVLPSTEDSLGISSFCIGFLWDKGPNGVWPKNDGVIWNKLAGGSMDTAIVSQNIMMWCGTGPFGLEKWNTERYSLAMIFGSDLDDVLMKKKFAHIAFQNNFDISPDISNFGTLPVTIVSPSQSGMISGNNSIQWTIDGAVGKTTTNVYLSSDEQQWTQLGIDSTGKNSLEWNSETYPDGALYVIRLITSAENGMGMNEVKYVAINNSVQAKPEIRIDETTLRPILSDTVQINFIAGDADADPCMVQLCILSPGTGLWEPISPWISLSTTEKAYHFIWDTKNFPNSFSGTTYLQAKIVSGADTVQSKIFPISISNTMVLHNIDGLILSRRGFGTGKVAVVTNGTPPALSRTYRLTFLSTGDSLLCRITDAVTNIDQFGQYKIGYGKSESPTFDNIRIEIENDRIAVAGEHTGWKNPAVLFPMTVDIDNLNPLKTIKTPYDYDISFSSAIVDTSVGASGLYHQIPVRFKVKNIVTNTFLKFLVQDMDNNYLLSRGDTIRILEDYVSLVNFKFAWKMGYGTINGNESEPGDGDIFSIVTTKPFSQSDTIIFSTDKLVSVEDGPVDGPYSFDLAQNYPNPFNPVTTIQFTIPSQQQVKIVVYDILGKEIAVLVNERLSAGGHTVQFNAASLPSGIYFYRLQSQNFVSTKKLLLIK